MVLVASFVTCIRHLCYICEPDACSLDLLIVSDSKSQFRSPKRINSFFFTDDSIWCFPVESKWIFSKSSAVNQVIPVAFHRRRLSLWINNDLHIFRLRPSIQHNRLHTSMDKSSSGRDFDALDLLAYFKNSWVLTIW